MRKSSIRNKPSFTVPGYPGLALRLARNALVTRRQLDVEQ
jgi:hypothetical protein